MNRRDMLLAAAGALLAPKEALAVKPRPTGSPLRLTGSVKVLHWGRVLTKSELEFLYNQMQRLEQPIFTLED